MDRRGPAAHPAVRPDLHRLGGQPVRAAAPQAGRGEPVHLVVDDEPVDPLPKCAGLVRLGKGGERVAAHVRIARRGHAERREVPSCILNEPGAPGGVHPGEVMPEVALEQREHRALEHHAVEPALVVAAEDAAGRIRLPVLESGLAQGRRVEHAGVQRRVVEPSSGEADPRVRGRSGTASSRSARVG